MNKFLYIFLAFIMTTTTVGSLTACEAKKEPEEELPSTGDGDTGGGGGDNGGVTPITTQENFRIIFVTTTEVNGSGASSGTGSGLASFDALCETERVAKGLPGVFKALIFTTNRRPLGSDWILRKNKEYRREDLTTVIGTAVDVPAEGVKFDFPDTPLTNTITAATKYVWTGFKNDWTASDMTYSNWTTSDFDNTSATMGSYGKSSIKEELVDLGWTQYQGGPLYYDHDANLLACSAKHPVYCVQTRQAPPAGTQKILFRSVTTRQGNAGLSGFDSACATDATAKGLSGTYKAVIGARDPGDFSPTPALLRGPCSSHDCDSATGMSEAVNWVLLPNTIYVNEDKTYHYGKTNEHGVFSGELEEHLPATNTWTGLTTGWIPYTTDNCINWTYQQADGNGRVGTGTSLSSGTAISSGVSACNQSQHLLCAEQ